MWKPSKLVLFIIIFTMTICAGISSIFIDWESVSQGKNLVKELQQPILFLLLSLYFVFPYVKKIKEEESGK
ncbi:hypothetical protein [Kordia sp.]|uniref:hypothetical protein n=1 Tax=Kordia sp. TaxID=1965332 RepID=UPI003D2C2E14